MNSVLPYSGREIMTYPGLRQALANVIFKLAAPLGYWQYPADIDVEDSDSYWRMVNWSYIAGKPVTRAERGTNLESFFASYLQPLDAPLPSGFQEKASLALSAVGDVLCSKALHQSEGILYEQVADRIFCADLSFANLESTLTRDPLAETTFRPGEVPKISANLAQFGTVRGHKGRQYTVFQTANNHILDCGMEGLDTTHDLLEAEGFRYVGTNRTPEDAEKGLIVTVNGIRLGFVAATSSVNNRSPLDDNKYLVNLVRFHRHDCAVDLSLLEKQIAYCRSEGCDLVIVGLHWGCEWEFYPRHYQIPQAHSLAELGADVIIGHSAHVIQPFEWYRPKRDPDRIVPILYGLGNLTPVFSISHTVLSLIANLQVVKGSVNGVETTLVRHVDLTPVMQVEFDRDGKHCAQLRTVRDMVRQSHKGEMRAYVDQIAGYADLVLGGGWRNG